jgi:hypothetical protein
MREEESRGGLQKKAKEEKRMSLKSPQKLGAKLLGDKNPQY